MERDQARRAATVHPATPTSQVSHRSVAGPSELGFLHARLAHRALEAWPSPAVVLGRDGTILLTNRAWRALGEMQGGGPRTTVGANYLEVCDRALGTDADADARAVRDAIGEVLAGEREHFRRVYPCHTEHVQAWWEVSVTAVDGPTPTALVVHTDVSQLKRSEDAAAARTHLLDQVHAAVIVTDLAGVVTLWNRAAEELYGWDADEAIGRPITELTVPEGAAHQAADMVRRLQATGSWEGQFTARRRDGSLFPAQVRNSVMFDPGGEPLGMVGISLDVSARVLMEEQLDRSHRELEAVTDGMGDGVCRIDPSGRMTYVNAQGAHLLRADIATVAGSAAVGWLHPRDQAAAKRLVATQIDETTAPVECTLRRADGTDLPCEYVATPLSPHGVGPRDWVVVFRDVSERHAREAALAAEIEELRWLHRIREALTDDGFVLHFQPIVELSTRRVVHHEVLLRMRDARDPTVLHLPGRFIPVAEPAGLAPAIDRWVIGEAIRVAAAGTSLHINLSATSLADADLPRYIGRLLTEHAVEAHRLVFEITETALLDNVDAARHFADRLRELGCGLALDDFGTGYGGFTYLKRLPVDALKIDIDFVRDATTDAASRHVIDAVVSLARAFGLRTVAEGVEDEATFELLREAGVDWAQGYLLGRPAPQTSLTHPEDDDGV